jgi:hypothetical protein
MLGYFIEVVLGTHPIPEKYYEGHLKLKSWESPNWQEIISSLINKEDRLAYN